MALAGLDLLPEEGVGLSVEECEAPAAAAAHDRAARGRHLGAAAGGERQRDDHAGRGAAGEGQAPHHFHERGEVVPARPVAGGQRGETLRQGRGVIAGADRGVRGVPNDDVRSLGEGRENAGEGLALGKQGRRGVAGRRVRVDVAAVEPPPQVGQHRGVVGVVGAGLGEAEREGVGHTQVAADTMPLGPRRRWRLTTMRGTQALVEQDETGRVDGQRVDVDSVEAALDEIESVQAGLSVGGEVEHGLEENPGAACRIEDERRAGFRRECLHGLAHDVFGDVRRRVEHAGVLLGAPGFPRTGVPHDAGSAPGAVGVEDVGQEVSEVVAVLDGLELAGGFAVGEFDDGVGEAARRGDGADEPGLGIAQRRIAGQGADAAADDAHAHEGPGRLQGGRGLRSAGFFPPPARQDMGVRDADRRPLLETAPHALHGGPDRAAERLGGGDE